MKVDKIMMILYRIISFLVAIVIILGFVVSCFGSPITARAIDERTARLIDDYRQEMERQFKEVEGAVLEDIKNGNLDATSDYGKYVLSRTGLQLFLIYNPQFQAIFDSAELVLDGIPDGYFDNNPTTEISGGGVSGLYRSYKDSELHLITLTSANSLTFGYSDEFSIGYRFSPSPDNIIYSYSSSDTTYRYRVTPSYSSYPYTIYYGGMSGDYFNETSTSYNYPTSNFGFSLVIFSNVAPTLNANFFQGILSVTDKQIGAYASDFETPVDIIDTDRPWDYYNQDIFPLLEDLPDKYVIFPDGYSPSIPEPTEPATTPNGGIYIDKQFNIGINIFVPTDSNGEPITDTNGETVTETAYITETYPTDAEYNFMIPTLEPLRTYQATMPNIDLTPFTDGFAFIWTATENIFTRSGFMPVVIACLGLAVVAYIIWKVGG